MSRNSIAQESSVPSDIEPIESWQILAVERVDGDAEPARWGKDGRHVVAWFDLGELREHIEGQSPPLTRHQDPTTAMVPRLLQWIRSLVFGPHRYRLAGDAT